MEVEKKLDELLMYFKEHSPTKDNLELHFINYDSKDLRIWSDKLYRDGFITIYPTPVNGITIDNPIYEITVEGQLFKGYVSVLEVQRLSLMRNRVVIVATTIGTSLAGLYGLFEILKYLLGCWCCN